MAVDDTISAVREAAPHDQDHNHSASRRRLAERYAVPAIRHPAAVLRGRARAFPARKSARLPRSRKEFERVEHPHHDREIVRTLPGRPLRRVFCFGHFAFGAGCARRRDTAGSAEAPSPRPVQARLQRSLFLHFSGDVVQREDSCPASRQCRFDPDRLHQLAVIVQWQDVSLPVSQRGFDSR